MLGDGVGDVSASELSFGAALADGDGIGESVGCAFASGVSGDTGFNPIASIHCATRRGARTGPRKA